MRTLLLFLLLLWQPSMLGSSELVGGGVVPMGRLASAVAPSYNTVTPYDIERLLDYIGQPGVRVEVTDIYSPGPVGVVVGARVLVTYKKRHPITGEMLESLRIDVQHYWTGARKPGREYHEQ